MQFLCVLLATLFFFVSDAWDGRESFFDIGQLRDERSNDDSMDDTGYEQQDKFGYCDIQENVYYIIFQGDDDINALSIRDGGSSSVALMEAVDYNDDEQKWSVTKHVLYDPDGAKGKKTAYLFQNKATKKYLKAVKSNTEEGMHQVTLSHWEGGYDLFRIEYDEGSTNERLKTRCRIVAHKNSTYLTRANEKSPDLLLLYENMGKAQLWRFVPAPCSPHPLRAYWLSEILYREDNGYLYVWANTTKNITVEKAMFRFVPVGNSHYYIMLVYGTHVIRYAPGCGARGHPLMYFDKPQVPPEQSTLFDISTEEFSKEDKLAGVCRLQNVALGKESGITIPYPDERIAMDMHRSTFSIVPATQLELQNNTSYSLRNRRTGLYLSFLPTGQIDNQPGDSNEKQYFYFGNYNNDENRVLKYIRAKDDDLVLDATDASKDLKFPVAKSKFTKGVMQLFEMVDLTKVLDFWELNPGGNITICDGYALSFVHVASKKALMHRDDVTEDGLQLALGEFDAKDRRQQWDVVRYLPEYNNDPASQKNLYC